VLMGWAGSARMGGAEGRGAGFEGGCAGEVPRTMEHPPRAAMDRKQQLLKAIFHTRFIPISLHPERHYRRFRKKSFRSREESAASTPAVTSAR
jgi:hypothetical protein